LPLFNIILVKASQDGAGVSGCCPFDFGAVMGQEDLYREDPPGTRVDNALTARIVWGTTVPATSRVIWGRIDDVGFPNDTGVVASGENFHEVFFPVTAVNTTYKFQIITTSTECDPSGETLQSGTYYFEVGGDLILGEYTITIDIDADPYVIVIQDMEVGDGLTGSYDETGITSDIESVALMGIDAEVDVVPDEIISEIDATYLFTDYSTSVS
jgi:hypothetical protein